MTEHKSADERVQLRVVAAAIKLSDGRIVVGVRHYDELMRHWLPSTPDPGAVQGFVLSNYKFAPRHEAFKVAKEAGQILPGEGRHGTLYSEDVW